MGVPYVVIADDLTGSNDTGIQFLKAGYSASVIFDPAVLPTMDHNVVAVIDTESRNIPAAMAAARLEEVAKYFSPWKRKSVIYKKVDSTLRGNIAAEVAVLHAALNLPVIAFAPAYPKNKRTVKDGLLLLDGVPVAETEMGRDPRKPVPTSSLAEVLRGEGSTAVRHIALPEIRELRIPEIVKEMGGKGAFSFDTEHDHDLQLIVDGLTQVLPPQDILWVGSAGMAEALVAPPRPFLLVVGSVSPKSALQARCVLAQGAASPLLMDVAALLQNPTAEEDRLTARAVELLRTGLNVLIASALEEEQLNAGRSGRASEAISLSLAAVVARVLDAVRVGGLFLTGGEVAVGIARALHAEGTTLVDEIEPGIPLVRLLGGKFPGMPVVTKAGGFGDAETMVHCLAALSETRWRCKPLRRCFPKTPFRPF